MRHERGMTLVELVIGVAIASLIMTTAMVLSVSPDGSRDDALRGA